MCKLEMCNECHKYKSNLNAEGRCMDCEVPVSKLDKLLLRVRDCVWTNDEVNCDTNNCPLKDACDKSRELKLARALCHACNTEFLSIMKSLSPGELNKLLLTVRDTSYDVFGCKDDCPLRDVCDESEKRKLCSEHYCICEEEEDEKYLKIVKEVLKDE